MNIEEYIVARVNALMHTDDASIVKRLEGVDVPIIVKY